MEPKGGALSSCKDLMGCRQENGRIGGEKRGNVGGPRKTPLLGKIERGTRISRQKEDLLRRKSDLNVKRKRKRTWSRFGCKKARSRFRKKPTREKGLTILPETRAGGKKKRGGRVVRSKSTSVYRFRGKKKRRRRK